MAANRRNSGLPNHNNFPFVTLEGAAALQDRYRPTPNKAVDSSTEAFPALETSEVVAPKTSKNAEPFRKIDLKSALQYGTAQGYPLRYSYLRPFARENMHSNVPYAGGPEITSICGSTNGFAKTIEALSNIWVEGQDPVGDQPGNDC
ncbi:MAG: hypothetical protein Q9177_000559 [Variospora cf. flavescens]